MKKHLLGISLFNILRLIPYHMSLSPTVSWGDSTSGTSGLPYASSLHWPSLVLGVSQIFTAGLMALSTEGSLRWLAIGLAVIGVVLTLLTQRRGGDDTVAIKTFADILRTMNEIQADLSLQVPEQDGNTRELATLFNRFMERMRKELEDLQLNSLKVSLASSHGRKITEEANNNATQQKKCSELIFSSSNETVNAIEELSHRTNVIAEVNSRNLNTAHTSMTELMDVAEQIGTMTTMMQDFHGSVDRLESTSKNILAILTTVQDFAAQTNMLSLNATIEAARAGEAGKGFTVVASEIRELAAKVRGSADQINELVKEMNEAFTHSATGTQQVIDRAEKARTAVDTSSEQFQGMVQDFESTHNDLLRVSATVEELSVANRNIHNRSTEIRDLAIQIHQDMDRSSTHAAELRSSTDEALLKLCQFRIGRGYLEHTLETIEERRDVLQEAIKRLLDEGVDMFDRNHIPVPNTEPQKYEVSYARRFQETCQDLIDQWRHGVEGAIYCLPLDSEGFVAIHLSEVSQPPTGDPKIDLLKSRNMRFFERRHLSHEGRFLLQSYLRDTGDVMFNLSVPVIAKGNYWGGLYVGLPSKALGLD